MHMHNECDILSSTALELIFFFTEALYKKKIASVSASTDATLVVTEALLWYAHFALNLNLNLAAKLFRYY